VGKPIWILIWSNRWWGGSGISWTICKSFAPHFRHINTSTPHHQLFTAFLLCNTMLALHMLRSLSLSSVHPSVTSQYCIKTIGQIELVFGTEASYHLSHAVLSGNLGISKNLGTSPWNFTPNSGLRKFHHSKSVYVTLKLHHFDLLRRCCKTCFYSWQDFDWHIAHIMWSICGSRASNSTVSQKNKTPNSCP